MKTNNDLEKLDISAAEKSDSNEYSIYNYLKNTPSVLIASISALIAIITFFAQIISIISTRKNLLFWDFNISYVNIDNDFIAISVIMSIAYFFIASLSSILFSTTYEAYIPFKKRKIAIQYFKKVVSKEIKKVKRRNKYNPKSLNNLMEHYQQLCSSFKLLKKHQRKLIITNFVPIIFLMFLGCVIYGSISTISSTDTWFIIIIFMIIQIIALKIFSLIISKTQINRRQLKEECSKGDFIKYIDIDIDDDMPITTLIKNGIRYIFRNSIIISTVSLLLFSCVFIFLTVTIIPNNSTYLTKKFSVAIIENESYIIIYQDEEIYCLEKAITKIDDKEGKILIVYTDNQRIIKTDDISIISDEYDKVIKTKSHGENK